MTYTLSVRYKYHIGRYSDRRPTTYRKVYMTTRYKQYYRLSRADSERHKVCDVSPTPQMWQHNTPMTDEQLLGAELRECWEEVRSAWDDDDDHPDAADYSDMRVMSEGEFLLEAAQDDNYVELGNQVYDI